jgi:poly(3-hydroxybutyrate) depolymerase
MTLEKVTDMMSIRSAALGCLAFGTAALLLAGPAARAQSSDGGGAGRVERYPYSGPPPAASTPPPDKVYDYQVYIPPTHRKTKKWPLLVYVHACGTSADRMRLASAMSPVADAERFLVMYPDNGSNCWRALADEKTSVHRGAGGDADIITHMTRETMAKYNADPERVYIMGASGGAFMTSATVAAYPDLYAAAGVLAGGGTGMTAACMGFAEPVDPKFATIMVDRMGKHRRVVPFFSYGGTNDVLGESSPKAGCARRAFLQTMSANNIINPEKGGDRYKPEPAPVTGQVPNGRTWSKHIWRDSKGCVVGERWVIDGMGHEIGGGHPEHSDVKAPNSSRAAWAFLKRFRKSDTGGNCTESRR